SPQFDQRKASGPRLPRGIDPALARLVAKSKRLSYCRIRALSGHLERGGTGRPKPDVMTFSHLLNSNEKRKPAFSGRQNQF
ncbi:hypothetical protein, partial [Asticcacaulis sp.]|uniref:hypothetical protein n=1 Tax=Asticcacaulis sp. TaxID=1872648 RepID=UPI002602A440